jgi:electron transfer flavoprotein alpha subunit
VDITKESILVSVGRGIQQQNNLELAEALAAALDGTVSASRPVVDQGWLPTSRMVGKSGQQVKPRLYLALGISGAPEHIEGVPDFETMVAVNTDEQAPIFDFAQYGATVDVLELIPALTEKIKDVKGN